jgi:putative endonuclease
MPAAEAALDRRARGFAVEAAAREYLLAAGLRPLAGNVAFRSGELDLVMQDRDALGELLVFVEVRFRADDAFGGGAASVDGRKRRKLVHAARRFLAMHGSLRDAPCRFDVVEADGDPAAPRLHWLRDAFRADDA